MKKSLISVPILIALLGIFLSACTGGVGITTSWPGFTVDPSGETVYLAYATHIYAINIGNGSEKWRFPVAEERNLAFYASPTLTEDGQLIVGGYDNVLYSLNPSNGQKNWSYAGAKNHFIASPIASKGVIFAPSADSRLYAIDLAGTLLWSFPTGYSLWATPVMDEQRLYLPSMDHHLYALDIETGKQVWKSEDLGGALVGTPALSAEGIIYVGTFGSELLAVDASNGQVIWRFGTLGWMWSGPALQDDVLYFGDLKGTLYALNAKDGSVLWRAQLDTAPKRAIVGRPAVIGDMVLYGSESGTLFAVDIATGNPKWSKALGGPIYADAWVAGDTILVSLIAREAVLVALDMNGNQKWAFLPAKK